MSSPNQTFRAICEAFEMAPASAVLTVVGMVCVFLLIVDLSDRLRSKHSNLSRKRKGAR